jgi:putative endonuclease
MANKKYQQAFNRGIMAEHLGIFWLRLKGYRIFAHRFKTPVGEIDIIAYKGNTLIAVEVKARVTLQAAAESLTSFQRQRIERALQWFLTKNAKLAGKQLRFDIMLVAPWRVQHLKNAWWSSH